METRTMIRIGVMALVVFGIAGAASAQTAAAKRPAQTAVERQRLVEAAQQDWSQANAVLVEAVRRLSPCSPRLATLLTEARDTASALTRANARYFQLLLADERTQMKSDSDFAARAGSAIDDANAAVEILVMDQPPHTAGAAPGESVAPRTAYSSASSQLKESLATKEALLAEIEKSVAAEARRWNRYYDGLESGIRKLCTGAQPGTVKPRSGGAPKR